MDYQGLLTCARYAFPPNILKYCGPDKVEDLSFYTARQQTDLGLLEIIKDFQVLYPYLKLIAFENNIADPFDSRVVEAYWLGNSLLNNISMKSFYYHLLDEQQLKKKVSKKDLKWLLDKIPKGALPHHPFHVFNIFKRTGHQAAEHTLETMDACRIGWGRVIRVQGSTLIEVITQPLVFKKGKLVLGESVMKEIKTEYKNRKLFKIPPPGSWVSFHWDFFCDILTPRQVVNLEKYTKLSLNLANQTL